MGRGGWEVKRLGRLLSSPPVSRLDYPVHERLATFDDHEINVFVGNDQIERVNSSKSLGLKIDENLTWKSHMMKSQKKVSAAISA